MLKGASACASLALKLPITSHHTCCCEEILDCPHINLGPQHSTAAEPGRWHPSLRNSSPLRRRNRQG
jgi:hypothetical protein